MNRVFMQMPFRAHRTIRTICFKEGDPADGGSGFSEQELAALSAPEGDQVYQQPVQQQQQETPEQIAAKEAAAASAAQAAEAEKVKNQQQQQQATGEHLAGFSLLEKAYGLKIDTKDVTPENAADALVQTVLANYDWSEAFDPKVLELQKQIAAGKPFEEVVKQYAPAAQAGTDDEILVDYYKDTLGMTDEEATKEIEGLTNKNIELRRAKVYQQNKQQHLSAQQEQIQQQQLEQGWAQHVQSVEKDVDATLATFDNYTDIYGVKISGADKDNFKSVFKKLMVPDPKTPGAPALFHQLLDNDETLLRVAYMLVNGQKLTSELLSKPEEVRKVIEGKLLSDPGVTNSSRKQEDLDEATLLARLNEPEKLIFDNPNQ